MRHLRPDLRESAARGARDQPACRCGLHAGHKQFDFTGRFSPDKIKRYLSILDGFYGQELKRAQTTWLDIGCGFGEFLLALREHSAGQIDVLGIEPNTKKQEVARARPRCALLRPGRA